MMRQRSHQAQALRTLITADDSSDVAALQIMNPDYLESFDLMEKTPATTLDRSRSFYHFNLAASQLPGMQEQCEIPETSIFPTPQFLQRPNPVRLPIYRFYPVNPQGRSSLFCCQDYSKTPVQFLFKAVIEHIYHSVLDQRFACNFLHVQVHKNVHRAIDTLQHCFEKSGMIKMFERIAITMPDREASDVVINSSFNAKNLSYSNAAGEYMLSESFIKDVLSLKDTEGSIQFSKTQPVTHYFLQLIKEHSAWQPELRMEPEEILGYDQLFMIRTDKKSNRAYLPLVYCLGMLIGCPYAGFFSSKIWVFRKEMLYLCAKIFGIMNINISGLLYEMMKQDIVYYSKQHLVFCIPLWRVLMTVERRVEEPECLSHIPQTTKTVVEISRFADIVKRTTRLEMYEEAEIRAEQARIQNTYQTAYEEPPDTDSIRAVLMFESCLLKDNVPQFIPRLKWIHKRLRTAEFVEEEHTLEEKQGSECCCCNLK